MGLNKKINYFKEFKRSMFIMFLVLVCIMVVSAINGNMFEPPGYLIMLMIYMSIPDVGDEK